MTRKAALAFISTLVTATTLFANAGPARLPKDRKVAEPPVQFEGIDQHPGHVFYLHYGAAYFGSTRVEVKGPEPIKLDFKTKDWTPSAYLTLYAMERKEFEKRKQADPSLKWLTTGADGVLAVKLEPPETTIPATAKETPVTTYRVTLRDGKVGAEKMTQKQGAARSRLLAPLAVALFSSLSVACLGIWFTRRGAARAWSGPA